MCGICGLISPHQEKLEPQLKTMLSFLKKRGPDHQAIWKNSAVALGHSRLSIVDLSDAANQPMHFKELSLVFNGEIYNFKEIRKKLVLEGFQFKTTSDTEVLLKAFFSWGIEDTLKELEGMFAFALYDAEKEKLFLGRDRLGQKPLYYYHNGSEFFFSSDIRSIHKLHKQRLKLNLKALDYYLTELSMPQPHTIWEGVNQLSAAHYAVFCLKSFQLTTRPYWKLSINQKNYNLSLGEAVEYTKELLQAAIKKRLISDVPLGCFLSGGVDSGLVVSLLAEMQNEAVKTFSVGLDFQKMNELPDARIVADRYQTDHTEIIVKSNLIDDITNLVKYIGEPFADSSIIPSYLVSKAIRKDVTVALSGDGGDELFGGYNDYGLAYRSYSYDQKQPKGWRRSIATIADKVKSRFCKQKENMGAYAAYLKWPNDKRLFRQMGFDNKDALYQEDLKKEVDGFTTAYLLEKWELYKGANLIDGLMAASLQTRLLNDYLVKVDRSSMFASLEVRSPFLDTQLLEFAFSVPAEYKFHQNINKYILKNIAESYIDPNINNRIKRGFSIPIKDWLRKELKSWAESLLFGNNGLASRAWFRKEYLETIFWGHQEGKVDHTHKLWALICLELWAIEFLD